jgi:hypothetical protein
MKIAYLASLSAVLAIVLSVSSGFAAPIESVESAGASTAYQKVDAMLGEQIVARQLQAVGLTSQQAHARLAQLNDQQLSQLAAQADLIRAGGTIQHDERVHLGPLRCMWRQLTTFAINVYHLVFCWADPK